MSIGVFKSLESNVEARKYLGHHFVMAAFISAAIPRVALISAIRHSIICSVICPTFVG
jgi:hypothetical protein